MIKSLPTDPELSANNSNADQSKDEEEEEDDSSSKSANSQRNNAFDDPLLSYKNAVLNSSPKNFARLGKSAVR